MNDAEITERDTIAVTLYGTLKEKLLKDGVIRGDIAVSALLQTAAWLLKGTDLSMRLQHLKEFALALGASDLVVVPTANASATRTPRVSRYRKLFPRNPRKR